MDNNKSSENQFELENPFTPEEIKVSDEHILDSFKCPICHELVWDPITCTTCGHTSCRKCIENYYWTKKIQDRQCIFRCGGTTYRNMTNKEKEFIDFIKLKCRHNGCNQFINYSDYNSHFQNCDYRLCKCSNKSCKSLIPFCQIEEHAKNCEWREINCQKCKKKIIFNSKDNHIKLNCPKAIVKCDICGEEMQRIDYIKNHKPNYINCIKKIALISFKEINDYRKKLNEQNEKIKNMEQIINQNKIKLNENEKNIQLLRKENELLKNKNQENEKSIEELKLFMENKNKPKAQPLLTNYEMQNEHNINFDLNTYDNYDNSPKLLLNKRKRNIYLNENDYQNYQYGAFTNV